MAGAFGARCPAFFKRAVVSYMRRGRLLLCLVVTLQIPHATAAAQAGPMVNAVRVTVVDSSRRPVSGASVSIARGLTEILATATTDASGTRMFAFRDTGDYHVMVRRLGFRPADQFFAVLGGDSVVRVVVVLAPAPVVLDSVRVMADEDPKHKHLFIDADGIANSPRLLFDAVDIIMKLRPDMVFGLGGKGFCPPARNLWINGKRIFQEFVGIDSVAVARPGRDSLPGWIISALTLIRPEHIDEMRYRDCMDMSVGKIGSDRAIFVLLKPGVDYDPSVGSYVSTRPPPI